MTFEEMLGQEFYFYGVDSYTFKLGKQVFEAVEDESDGYRSYLGSVEMKESSGSIFFHRAVAKVRVVTVGEGEDSFVGYHLIDVVDGHVWLRLGTDHSDDYYPVFIFNYQPKAP